MPSLHGSHADAADIEGGADRGQGDSGEAPGPLWFTICPESYVVYGPDFETHFRVQGDLAALRAATVTACRNGSCYSTPLAPGVETLVAGPGTGLLIVDFPPPSLDPRNDPSFPGPMFKLTIQLKLLVTSSCTPWCNATLGYQHGRDDTLAKGDRFEMYFTPGGSRIRDTAFTAPSELVEVPADKCDHARSYGLCTRSHDREPPLRVR